PLSGIINDRGVQQAGAPPEETGSGALYSIITDGYFDALGLPMLRGRDFTPAEATSTTDPRVAIVDAPLAQRLFPGADALGQHIRLAPAGSGTEPIAMEIVGIAPGTPGDDFDPAPRPHVYVPFGQVYAPTMHVLVGVSERTADNASLLRIIRNEIRQV